MELSLLLGEQILALFLMGVIGYVVVKAKILKASDSKILSTLVVYVFSPCAIINAFQISLTSSKVAGLGLAFGAAVVIQLIFTILIKALGLVWKMDQVEKGSLIYTNVAYLIIPLVEGTMGEEWVFYTAAYIVVFNLLVWTHGVALICKGQGTAMKQILLNPNIIACVLGVVLFLTQIKIPSVAGIAVSGFAKTVGPLSMLVIGMLIGEIDLKKAFTSYRIYILCLLRLIVLPLLIIVLMKLLKVSELHPEGQDIIRIVLFAAAAPAATAVTQIAQVYDKDSKYASLINAVSVIFCVLTMPLISFLYEYL